MLRHSILFAIALCAVVSLAGCGANRLTGPQLGDAHQPAAGALGDHPRTDDPPGGTPGIDPVVAAPGSSADSLRTGDGGGDGGGGRPRTD